MYVFMQLHTVALALAQRLCVEPRAHHHALQHLASVAALVVLAQLTASFARLLAVPANTALLFVLAGDGTLDACDVPSKTT